MFNDGDDVIGLVHDGDSLICDALLIIHFKSQLIYVQLPFQLQL